MIPGLAPAALIAVMAALPQSAHPAAIDAVAQQKAATERAPRNPGAWYALGQAYNAIKENALASFGSPSDAPWRALLSADALVENDHFAEAFALYRAAL